MLKRVHTTAIRSVEFASQGADEGASHPEFSLGFPRGLWVDALGGFVSVGDTGLLHLTLLDGSTAILAGQPGPQGWGGVGWDGDDDVPVLVDGTTDAAWYKALLPVGVPDGARQAGGDVSMAVVGARKFRFGASPDGAAVRSGTLDGPFDTVDAVVDGTDGSGGVIAPAEPRPCRRWWCMSSATGRVHLYDSDAKAVVEVRRLPAGWLAAGYSRKHNIFITLNPHVLGPGPSASKPYRLDVFVNEPELAAITAPAFSPATRRGALSKVSARVLGADGEPCEAVVVTFEVDVGTLTPAAALTDEEGKAEVTYRAPLEGAAGTVTASVEE